MSIRVMQAVWEHSAQSGGALVLLLAIADNAHDDGDGAYPSIDTLSKKARMTPRNVNLLLKQLVAAGEIAIRAGAGPHRCNVYRVLLPNLATADVPRPTRPVAVCAMCASPPDDWHELHQHHIIPKHEGGSDRRANLLPLCYRCHALMHDRDHRQALTPLGRVLRDGGVVAAKSFHHEMFSGGKNERDSPKNPVADPEKSGPLPLKPVSPKPSLNRHREPSVEPLGETRAARVTLATYEPDDQMIAWVGEHHPDLDLFAIVENWRDHHKSRGTPIRDFDASLRTWLRNEPKFARQQPRSAQNLRSLTLGNMQALRDADWPEHEQRTV